MITSKSRLPLLSLIIALGLTTAGITTKAAGQSASEWVHPGPDGKLVYKTTSNGDRIMDFSYAGYKGGGVALPDVPVKKTIKPSGDEDDAALIQAAIDEVAAMPLENGFRGAVLLEPGTYPCSATIRISTSGVVLRGRGAQEGPESTLQLTGRPHLGIAVSSSRGRGYRGRRSREEQDSTGPRTSIADAYVPSGATSFIVADAAGFSIGDTIAIRKPVTQKWVEFMHMDDMTRNDRPQTWLRTGAELTTERQIVALSGNKITLDVPLSDSFDTNYLNPPGTAVVKIDPPQRVEQAGIENLHIICPPQEFNHTQRHFTAMRISGRDCWARDVICEETMNSVSVGGQRITLQRVAVNRKARHIGSSRPAEFAPNGSQVLLDRCSVNADNIWHIATGGRQAGPIVILNCNFQGDSRAESHQRWTTGMLYDSCRAPGGALEFRNRGSMGSGHGWSMGWGVMWNCVADSYVVQNPPGAANWMIGCIGENVLKPRPFGDGPMLPEGIKDSQGTPVTPKSLYLTQLAERLGPQALKNIGY